MRWRPVPRRPETQPCPSSSAAQSTLFLPSDAAPLQLWPLDPMLVVTGGEQHKGPDDCSIIGATMS